MNAVPSDQAARLRTLMETADSGPRLRLARGGSRVIAVASGKGGVGKTNVAVNLAIALNRRGRRVTLVDGDLGTANIDVLFNLPSRGDLGHVLRHEMSIGDVTIDVLPGLRLVPGASGIACIADLGAHDRAGLLHELAALENDCEVMIVDCGAGISPNVLAFARAADELLLVITPEPTALTDGYALIKVLARERDIPEISLLVNQAADAVEGQAVADRVAQTAGRFLGVGIRRVGQILRDEHVVSAVRQRAPFMLRYPRSPAASCMTMLATRMDPEGLATSRAVGFFHRFTSFFC